jgi:3-oxoadipate enol-lactonase
VRSFTTGDGCSLAYRLDPPSSRPVLVLSNSLGTTMDMWAPQIAPFSAHFRVLQYDSRGHGRSLAPPGGYSLDRLGRDLLELMDGLGIASAAFCGVSMGGMVGQWLGWRAPERVRALALCNTSAYMGPPSSWDERIAAVRAGGMAAVASGVADRWFTPAFRAASPDRVQAICSVLLQTDPVGYVGCCAAIRDMDQRRTAGLIAAPTLVLAGAADPATPVEHAQELAAAIGDAELRVVQAAHLSNVEAPAAFNDEVLGFLRRTAC